MPAPKKTPTPTLDDVNRAEAVRLRDALMGTGDCLDVRVLADGSVAYMVDLIYTRSIALGCHGDGWSKRYCFEDRELANRRFDALQSEDDVPEGFVATREGLRRAPVERWRRFG